MMIMHVQKNMKGSQSVQAMPGKYPAVQVVQLVGTENGLQTKMLLRHQCEMAKEEHQFVCVNVFTNKNPLFQEISCSVTICTTSKSNNARNSGRTRSRRTTLFIEWQIRWRCSRDSSRMGRNWGEATVSLLTKISRSYQWDWTNMSVSVEQSIQ